MINKSIISTVEKIVQSLCEENLQQRPGGLRIAVEHPANLEHGDYSINVAMQLAKTLNKPPMLIANEIKEKLMKHPLIDSLFYKVEVVAPGFINLFLNWENWAAEENGKYYCEEDPLKVLIEHTSINPNKSAHIGHLRNSCIGDTTARMLQRIGHQVEVHNYIDDLGNQLADTLVGMMNAATEQPYTRFGDFCWDTYAAINRAYKANPALEDKRAEVLHELEKGHSNTAWMGLLVAERIVREHLEEMKQFDIRYNVLVWESQIVREGFWASTFRMLQETSIFYQETKGKLAGCWVLKQSEDVERSVEQDDLQTDKVLVRSNGILTYTAKDIAYHLWKFGVLDRDFRYKKFTEKVWSTHSSGVKKRIGQADRVINVIDHRQEYPQLMVKQALKALGFEQQAEQLKHVSYGVVSLSPATAAGLGVDISEGKSSYPMSGRQGIGIKISDFLDYMEQVIDAKRSNKSGLSSRSIAAAAVRYYLLKYNLQTEVVFDIDQVTEVSGNTGVYLLYSYARACSILDKGSKGSLQSGSDAHSFDQLEVQELSLLRQLAYWPETLDLAARELTPHILCNYAHELTTHFSHFYAACPILKAEKNKQSFRLWLTRRYKETLQDVLETLGLPAPSKM